MHLAVIALTLLAACVIVQSLGMLLLIHWLARARHIVESPSTLRRLVLLLRLILSIVLLHLIQIGLWATVYWQAGELPTEAAGAHPSRVRSPDLVCPLRTASIMLRHGGCAR